MSQQNPTDAEATKYAESYILYGDQSKAFRAAFPKAKAKPETVYVKASNLHKHDKIQVRIGELRKRMKDQSEEEFDLTASKIKMLLAKAASMGMKTKLDAQGNKVPVSLSGAVSAINEINKMDGNHAPTRGEITGRNGGPVQVLTLGKDEYKQAREEMLEYDDC